MDNVIQELLAALEDQLARCPGCWGVSKVRTADGGRTNCLVCESAHKELSIRQEQSSSVQTGLLFAAARIFVKRCPACFGIRRVWTGPSTQPCLGCARLHYAIEAFQEQMTPEEGIQVVAVAPDSMEPERLQLVNEVDDEPDVPGIVRMPKTGGR